MASYLKKYSDVLIKSEYIEHEYEYITHNFLEYEYFKNVHECTSTEYISPRSVMMSTMMSTFVLFIQPRSLSSGELFVMTKLMFMIEDEHAHDRNLQSPISCDFIG